MAGCFGRLFKKRGKSLPPQVTKDAKSKGAVPPQRFDPKKPTAINASMPNLATDKSKLTKPEKGSKELGENEIYPAPEDFREKDNTLNDPEGSTEEGEVKRTISKRKEEQIDYLNELNKDLQEELKHTITPRGTLADVDEPSNSSATSGRNNPPSVSKRSRRSEQAMSAREQQDEEDEKNEDEQQRHYENLVNKSLTFDQNNNNNNLNTTSRTNTLVNENTKKSANVSFKLTEPQVMMEHQRNSAIRYAHHIKIEDIQRLVDNFNMDNSMIDDLKAQIKRLNSVIFDLRNELLEKDKKFKEENDFVVNTVHNTLARDVRTEEEREALLNMIVSKQAEKNETLIREQARLIDALKLRCLNYERELGKGTEDADLNLTQIQLRDLKGDIHVLRSIIYRLNIELSSYQAKFPSPTLQTSLKQKIELKELPDSGQIPIWLVNTKYLSPLVAAYEDRLTEKNDKLKLLKKKIDDLASKFKTILDENSQLHTRLSGQKSDEAYEDDYDTQKIRHHALLVLEENKVLCELNDLSKQKFIEAQKKYILEVGELSKRLIIMEMEKNDVKNKWDSLKTSYDELQRKNNDAFAEIQRRVKLDDHLNQINELTRKIDEVTAINKQESKTYLAKIFELETARKELSLKSSSLSSEVKRLTAENEVLDKALNEGVGRKVQHKLQMLEKKLELAQIKEKSAQETIDKLEKELEIDQKEKEILQKQTKNTSKKLKGLETEVKKRENKIAEENLKTLKMENKLDSFKEKVNKRMAEAVNELATKESQQSLVKLEYENRISDLLSLLQKKEDRIEDLLKEKRQTEAELETVWQATSSETRRLKENLLDYKMNNANARKKFVESIVEGSASSHYKLLLDD